MTEEERSEIKKFAGQSGLGDHISAQEAERLFQATRPLCYARGALVHTAVHPCEGILLIRSGCLRIYLLSDEGRDVTLYHLRAGDVCILSASCVLDAISFDVLISAEEETEVFQIQAPAFRALVSENIYVQSYAYQMAVRRFSDIMWAMQQILFRGVDKRLASWLCRESDRSGSSSVCATQEQIASSIGSSREVVSRMLKYFSEEGMVQNHRGRIDILDGRKLEELAGS